MFAASLRRWVILLLIAAGLLAAVFIPWWRQQQFYRRPSFRLALQRSLFLHDPLLGGVADIKVGRFHPGAGEEIAIVGESMVYFTDLSGHIHSHLDLQAAGKDTQLLFTGHAGGYVFFQPGLSNPLALMDQHGKACWRLAGDGHSGKYAAGDVNGDGHIDYVTGWLAPHAGFIRLLGDRGQTLWQREDADAFFHDFAVVDVKGDGRREIVYPERDHLEMLDGRGHAAGEVRLPFPLETYSLCRWPLASSAPLLLTLHHTALWLIGFDGRPLARYYVPGDYYDSRTYYGTSVSLRPGEAPYFAVVLNNGQGRLLLYDSHGAIIYEGRFADDCSAIFPIPSQHDPHMEDLLLCSEKGMIWRLGTAFAASKLVQINQYR